VRTIRTTDLFRLDGRVAIVTGAAGMLGGEFAEALGDFHAHVVLADLNADICAERAERLRAEKGVDSIGVACDVRQEASWHALVGAVEERFGPIDILVNNAAFTNASQSSGFASGFEVFPREAWEQILEVNLTGVFLGCKVVGARMLAQAKGSIINLASLYGVVSPHHRIYQGTGISQPVAYSVSKAGVIALTRYLGTLWAERGVRVNAITPGGVFDQHQDPFLSAYQKLSPMGRMADRNEMRGALVYLASEASRYCAGHNLVVDGGWTAW
jgi:NAD(P)-dependent dehydrogenase (short-subunit alcohol dehydrogenase family)